MARTHTYVRTYLEGPDVHGKFWHFRSIQQSFDDGLFVVEVAKVTSDDRLT